MRAEVERYARGDSPLHAWEARWKLAAAGGWVAVLVGLQRWESAAAGVAVGLGGVAAARLPVRWVVTRLAQAHVMLLPVLVVLPLAGGGETFPLGPLALSQSGLRQAGVLYLRALALICVGLLVVGSTPMGALLRALEAFRLPRPAVDLALLTYRYLFTLGGELTRLRRALAARGFVARGRPESYRTLARVVGVTLVRSVERAERVQLALRARGFHERCPGSRPAAAGAADRLKTLAALLAAAALAYRDRVGGG